MPFISIDNKKIYYEISGNGPVIILHHGFSQNTDIVVMVFLLLLTIPFHISHYDHQMNDETKIYIYNIRKPEFLILSKIAMLAMIFGI